MMMSDVITNLPASQIIAGDNDRTDFDPTALQDLADSIKENGLACPPTVRKLGNGKYQIICGERRTRAVRDILKWQTIPCIMKECDDDSASDLMLAENTARQDLDPIDEARAYQKRVDAGQTVAQVAKTAGVSSQRVSNRIKLLTLRDELQKLVRDGQLTLGYAQTIADFELDTNRQMIAVKALQASDHPTIGLLRATCNTLKEQQSQDGFNFGIFAGECSTLPVKVQAVEPPLPGKVTPPRKESFIKTLKAGWRFWTQAADEWRGLGRDRNAEKCNAAAQSLADVAMTMFGSNFQTA